jgi:hypothetical protein
MLSMIAHLAPLEHPVTPVMTVSQGTLVRQVLQVNLELLDLSQLLVSQVAAVNALLDLVDHLATKDSLDNLATPDHSVLLVAVETLVDRDHLVNQAPVALLDVQETLEDKDDLETMELQVAREHQDLRDHLDLLDRREHLDPVETVETLDNPADRGLEDHLDLLDHLDSADNLVHPVHLLSLARMPTTAHAHAETKPKWHISLNDNDTACRLGRNILQQFIFVMYFFLSETDWLICKFCY